MLRETTQHVQGGRAGIEAAGVNSTPALSVRLVLGSVLDAGNLRAVRG